MPLNKKKKQENRNFFTKFFFYIKKRKDVSCALNLDAHKIRIFSLRARSFVHLNKPCVLNSLYVNNTSLVIIIPIQAFFKGDDIWQLIHMIPLFLFSCCKRNYIRKLINSLPVDPYTFDNLDKMLFNPRALHRLLWEAPLKIIPFLVELRTFLNQISCFSSNSLHTTCRWLSVWIPS